MKSFFKTVLAVICGILILHIIGLIFLFSLVGAAGSGKTVLPRNGVLDISLADYALSEQTQDSPIPDMASLNFEMSRTVGLWDAVQAIEAAAADPAIQYIFLRPDGGTAGMAGLEELRTALLEFRKSGKAVVAFLEAPGNGGYYLATAADKIYLSSYHGATYQMFGLSSQQFFLKDILEKLG
ncbi:MAG: S49 family peptidase, partial [Bacteroidales bacterium]|nr:S49 family peptidase [Bacteroidales bacterium]